MDCLQQKRHWHLILFNLLALSERYLLMCIKLQWARDFPLLQYILDLLFIEVSLILKDGLCCLWVFEPRDLLHLVLISYNLRMGYSVLLVHWVCRRLVIVCLGCHLLLFSTPGYTSIMILLSLVKQRGMPCDGPTCPSLTLMNTGEQWGFFGGLLERSFLVKGLNWSVTHFYNINEINIILSRFSILNGVLGFWG